MDNTINWQAVEQVECDAWDSLCRAAPPEVAHGLGLEIHRYGDAILTLCPGVDQGQFNRLLGLGWGNRDSEAIAEAASRFRAAGIKNPFIQIVPGHENLDAAASKAGFVPHKRPWVKFHWPITDLPPVRSEIDVRPASGEEAGLFGSIIATGFGMPPVLAAWLSALVGRAGWHCYLAWSEGRAIGGAALFLHGQAAWLGVGAVVPNSRRKGAQSALLARRISDAVKAGANLVTTETGKPLPGEDHPSYRNIGRSGFTFAYERSNWTFAA